MTLASEAQCRQDHVNLHVRPMDIQADSNRKSFVDQHTLPLVTWQGGYTHSRSPSHLGREITLTAQPPVTV